MFKIIVILCALLLLGCAEKPDENVYYVRETTTSHCFKVWGPKGENFMWIDCHKLPKRGDVRDEQEFDTEGMTEWEEE
jgi:hypothetical protein